MAAIHDVVPSPSAMAAKVPVCQVRLGAEADQPHRLTVGNEQVEPAQHPVLIRTVAEPDVAQFDAPPQHRQRGRSRRDRQVRPGPLDGGVVVERHQRFPRLARRADQLRHT